MEFLEKAYSLAEAGNIRLFLRHIYLGLDELYRAHRLSEVNDIFEAADVSKLGVEGTLAFLVSSVVVASRLSYRPSFVKKAEEFFLKCFPPEEVQEMMDGL